MAKAAGVALLLGLAALLGACAVTLEPAEIKVKPVTVEVGAERTFCPPGHRMQGRC